MSLLKDIQLAARLLIKDRSLTFAAVAALALGIAATTTAFTIVNAVALRPMPFQDPDRIVDSARDRPPAATAACRTSTSWIGARAPIPLRALPA